MMNVEKALRECGTRSREDGSVAKNTLAAFRLEAEVAADESRLTQIWCLEEAFGAQEKYLAAFVMLQGKEYYEAWCALEEIEIALKFLAPHFRDRFSEFSLDLIERRIEGIQSLFPYKIFASPEFLALEKKCGICGTSISVRNTCGHRVGQIYGGKMCSRVVTKMELLGLSMVTDPVQKYSVAFPRSRETINQDYDYELVARFLRLLKTPLAAGEIVWTKREVPHSAYYGTGRKRACPCGARKTYKACCAKRAGVLLPHCEFVLPVAVST